MTVKRFSVIPITDHIDNWRIYTAPQNSPDSLAEGLRRDVVDLGLTTFETTEDKETYTERKKKEKDEGERRQPRIEGDRDALHAHLREALAAAGPLGPDRPVVLFVHGFQFDPRAYRDQTPGDSVNPHVQLFRYSELQADDDPEMREHLTHATPWLKRAADGEDFPGLAVCFGYESWGDEFDVATQRQKLATITAFLDFDLHKSKAKYGFARNVYAQAYFNGKLAALFLAEIIAALDAVMTAEGIDAPVHLFAHSLGTRVALFALETVALDDQRKASLSRVGRVLLLAGAALQIDASATKQAILKAGGARPEFINVYSPSDKIVEVLGARAAGRTAADDRPLDLSVLDRLGRFLRGWKALGIEGAEPGPKAQYGDWVDIDLTSGPVQAWAAEKGLSLRGTLRTKSLFLPDWIVSRFDRNEIFDHWVHYTHAGNWALYRGLLFAPADWPLSDLPDG